MQVGLKYKLQDAQKIKINVDKAQGHHQQQNQKKPY
jgi:hypothetical protein